MQIIPVIDVQSGIAVRAIGGRRSEYLPLVSKITDSTDPAQVSAAFRDRFGLSEIYLADLDAIAGATPDFGLYRRLRADGFRIWVDAGVRDEFDIEQISDSVDEVVAGSETICPSSFSRDAVKQAVFSLDLLDGKPLGAGGDDPFAIVERVVAAGIERVIVLDLARVGSSDGPVDEKLCAGLIRLFAPARFFVGGGVRTQDDIKRLESIGVAGVLLASALHDNLSVIPSVAKNLPNPTQGQADSSLRSE